MQAYEHARTHTRHAAPPCLQCTPRLAVLDLGQQFEVNSNGLTALGRCPGLLELSFGNVCIEGPLPGVGPSNGSVGQLDGSGLGSSGSGSSSRGPASPQARAPSAAAFASSCPAEGAEAGRAAGAAVAAQSCERCCSTGPCCIALRPSAMAGAGGSRGQCGCTSSPASAVRARSSTTPSAAGGTEHGRTDSSDCSPRLFPSLRKLQVGVVPWEAGSRAHLQCSIAGLQRSGHKQSHPSPPWLAPAVWRVLLQQGRIPHLPPGAPAGGHHRVWL